MELRDIEYFSVIAKHGHLGRAAESLGLSQPALSMSLRRLEKSMQAKLVKRTPKGVELTAVGTALLSRVHGLRLSMNDVAREAADLSQGSAGDLRIGATPEFAEYLLPPAFSALFKVAPKVTVKVTVAAPDALRPALRSGELDLLVSGIASAPFEDLVSVPLLDDEFVVVSSVNHRLAKRERVTISDLAQERVGRDVPRPPQKELQKHHHHQANGDQRLHAMFLGGPRSGRDELTFRSYRRRSTSLGKGKSRP